MLKTKYTMTKYSKPRAEVLNLSIESNIMVASLNVGDTPGDQNLTRRGGWNSEDWQGLDLDEEDDF